MPGNAKPAIFPGTGIDPAAGTQRTVNREGVGKGWQVKIKSNRQERQERQEKLKR
jgi:glycine cleavage system H lipoate-binding protein